MTTKKGQSCPPVNYLLIVGDHCPRASSTYIRLWQNKDDFNRVKTYVDSIRLEYLTTPTRFNTQLLELLREGLIGFNKRFDKDDKEFYIIELTDWSLTDEAACW